MPSTILSDNGVTSGTSGIKTTGSNDGTLALQTTTAGGTATTALTINTTQAIGVGSSPSYGTSGQVLTSAGSGSAPTWTTVSTSAATPTALGTVYGNTTSSGTENCAGGYQALNVATGIKNCAFGTYSGFQITSGTLNTLVGGNSGAGMTTGSNNVGVGFTALSAVTTGASNTAVGTNALKAMTTTNSNVAVGNSAGQSTTTGYENVFVGAGAGLLNTTGYFNICIGRSAGENTGPTTGASNTLIGNDARVTSASANTQLVVAARQTAVAKGDNTGFIDGGTGGIYQGNNSSSWSTTSDFRLKKNIVDNTQGLDIISQVRVRNFEYRTAEEVTELPEHTVVKKEGVQLGVIAQELQQVCSDCVKIETTGVMSVDSDNLFWHMVNAIKDLKAINDTQAATINALTARIVALENRA